MIDDLQLARDDGCDYGACLGAGLSDLHCASAPARSRAEVVGRTLGLPSDRRGRRSRTVIASNSHTDARGASCRLRAAVE